MRAATYSPTKHPAAKQCNFYTLFPTTATPRVLILQSATSSVDRPLDHYGTRRRGICERLFWTREPFITKKQSNERELWGLHFYRRVSGTRIRFGARRAVFSRLIAPECIGVREPKGLVKWGASVFCISLTITFQKIIFSVFSRLFVLQGIGVRQKRGSCEMGLFHFLFGWKVIWWKLLLMKWFF